MITTAAILGFGRFGSALAERLTEAGIAVRAYDPEASVPEAFAAPDPCSATDGAGVVFLAVPALAVAGLLREIRPVLTSEQIVADVASVKSGPAADMQEILGEEIPWVATHPLFGPISLARGERPLKVVVCPNPAHPEAVESLSSFYWQCGFDPVEIDPETHDREMAETHALAFFIAKGFLDAKLPLDSPYAPPSVWGLRRVLDSVQADAGQLYATLQLDNPYSATSRRRLLSALTAADDLLREASHSRTAAESDARLHIAPPSAPTSPLLAQARESIDEIDRELLQLLERRSRLSLRAARAKAEVGFGVRDPKRENEMLLERRATAEELGLDPEAVEDIFQAILCLSRSTQSRADKER